MGDAGSWVWGVSVVGRSGEERGAHRPCMKVEIVRWKAPPGQNPEMTEGDKSGIASNENPGTIEIQSTSGKETVARTISRESTEEEKLQHTLRDTSIEVGVARFLPVPRRTASAIVLCSVGLRCRLVLCRRTLWILLQRQTMVG